jgi:PAP2 superfamily
MLLSTREKMQNGSTACRVFSLLLAGVLLMPYPLSADAVTDWNLTAVTALSNSPNAPLEFMILAYVHAAIYDAVNAIDGRHTVYAVKATLANPRASQEAAAIAAAYNVLKSILPDQQVFLDGAYATSLTNIPNGQSKNDGIAIGAEVAQGILALRANDGLGADIPYTFGSGPGVYQATAPGFILPVLRDLPYVKPFTLLSPSQFRADGPPALRGRRWARDFNETKKLGSLNNSARSGDQTQLGLFYTENPVTFYSRIFRDFAATRGLSLADNARLFARLHLGIGDALIAVFDSKYYFNFWRPITAIPAGGTDGNSLTDADPGWMPLAFTPPHPEYPSAHAGNSGMMAETLRSFFHTKKITIQFTSTVPNSGSPRILTSTDQIVEQVIQARIYGGMHFRTANEDGVRLGKQVAKWIAKNYFRRLHSDGQRNEGDRDDDEND